MVEDDNQFLEVRDKKIKEHCTFATTKKLGHCAWNRACLEGDEAVDEKRRQDAEQLSGSQMKPSSRDQFKVLSGAWLPMQWTAALFQSSPSLSSRKSAGMTRDWRLA